MVSNSCASKLTLTTSVSDKLYGTWRLAMLIPCVFHTESGAGQLLAELWRLVSGLPRPVSPVRLQSRQEFEQSLLRDLAASSLQVRKGCETEPALQAVLLGFERLVSGWKTSLGSHSLRGGRRGSWARHACLKTTSNPKCQSCTPVNKDRTKRRACVRRTLL